MERDLFPVVVHVLLLRRNGTELFLLRRANTGFLDGFYSLPGGHVHAGESLLEAAGRELEEEAGLEARLEPLAVMPYRAGRQQGINAVFEAAAYTGEPANNEPALFDAAVWAPCDSLPDPHPVWIERLLQLRSRGHWFEELHFDARGRLL